MVSKAKANMMQRVADELEGGLAAASSRTVAGGLRKMYPTGFYLSLGEHNKNNFY